VPPILDDKHLNSALGSVNDAGNAAASFVGKEWRRVGLGGLFAWWMALRAGAASDRIEIGAAGEFSGAVHWYLPLRG
jgi:hypothetical protein